MEYLIKMFALIANVYPNLLFENIKEFLKSFLLNNFSDEIANENLQIFKEYYYKFSDLRKLPNGESKFNEYLKNTIQLKSIDLPKKQKYLILIWLLFFEKYLLKFIDETSHFKLLFSDILNLYNTNSLIDENDYISIKGFIQGALYNIPDRNMLLTIGKNNFPGIDIAFMQRKNLNGQLFILYVKNVNLLLFYYKGNDSLIYNGLKIFPDHVYLFQKGYSITGTHIEPIYYNQIIQKFLINKTADLFIEVNKIEYIYNNSNNGIHQLSMSMETGQLIGILGRSGVGKSTLINILNGNLKPQFGEIVYNHINLYTESNKLHGLIGYVPQDDLLIEELSVYTNLYLNASLCFANLSDKELSEKTNNILSDFELYEVRNLKVGSTLNKYISGGQRKKLNIALELIREPSVLFVDEPTSGLSSTDAEEIMYLLTEQTIKGKIVIINIHQPSSDIFKLFDKIIALDKEGYPVYFGNPLDTITYFNKYTEKYSTNVDYCNVCENINPETIFKALEEKKVNSFGESTSERKTLPFEWHKRYLSELNDNNGSSIEILPEIELNKPNLLGQFIIFSKRNLLSKIANHSYVFLALSISPILAVILAYLCKSTNRNYDKYIFSTNDNIPSFLFMSVLVAIFIGLIISAEEIFRDRKILKRESYLHLNKSSYLFAKIFYLFALSAIQTFLYVVISNYILGFQGMTFYFWFILFSTSCFANVIGLLISSLFNSIVVIYIMVPLIIIPQILLSGVVIGFDKLNEKVSSKEFVPFIGDIMVSRWAFEALVVSQFEYNNYQKHFFDIEKIESNDKFNYMVLIPEIQKVLNNVYNSENISYQVNDNKFIINGLTVLNEALPFQGMTDIMKSMTIEKNKNKIEKYLNILNGALFKRINKISHIKDSIAHNLVKANGNIIDFVNFKNSNTNRSLSDMVLKRNSFETFFKYNNQLIREIEPIYQVPESKYGRAQFFSSVKRIGSFQIETFIFNIYVIWGMAFLVFILLYTCFYYKM